MNDKLSTLLLGLSSNMLLTRESGILPYMGGTKKEPKSALQRLFVQRLAEEMRARELSDKALERIARGKGHKISQPLISALKRFKHDPTLEKVHAIADALEIPAWFLMTPKDQVSQTVIRPPANVVKLPDPYPRIFSEKGVSKVTRHRRSRR